MSSMPCIHFGRINQPHRTVFCCFIGHKSGFIDTYTLFSCIHQYRMIWKTLQQTQAMTRAHITRSMYGENERRQPRLGKRMCTLIERADESMRQCKHTMVAIILLKLGLADWRNDATFRPSLNFGFAHVLHVGAHHTPESECTTNKCIYRSKTIFHDFRHIRLKHEQIVPSNMMTKRY